MPLEDTQNSRLLSCLHELLEAHRPVFTRVQTYGRCVCLVLGSLYAFGRKTVSQLISAIGAVKEDWSAWYRFMSEGRFEYDELVGCLFKQTLTHVRANEYYVTAMDATHIHRCSTTMPGTFNGKGHGTTPYKPGVSRQQRFENLCWLPRLEDGYSRALPLRMILAAPPKAVPAEEPPLREWQAGLDCLKWTRTQ